MSTHQKKKSSQHQTHIFLIILVGVSITTLFFVTFWAHPISFTPQQFSSQSPQPTFQNNENKSKAILPSIKSSSFVANTDPSTKATLQTKQNANGEVIVMFTLSRSDFRFEIQVPQEKAMKYHHTFYFQRASWSSDDSLIAFLIPGQLLIFSVETVKDTSEKNTQDVTHQVNLIKTVSLDFEPKDIFFSGNNEVIYFRSEPQNGIETIHSLSLKNEHFAEFNLESNSLSTEMSLVPASSEIVYWTSRQLNTAEPNSREFYLIRRDQGSQQELKLTNMPEWFKHTDWITKTLISPDHKHLCFEYGSSGTWSFVVGKIEGTTIKPVFYGDSYGYCSRWYDATHLVIKEKPYHDTDTYYSFFNTDTQKRELLHQEKNMNQ